MGFYNGGGALAWSWCNKVKLAFNETFWKLCFAQKVMLQNVLNVDLSMSYENNTLGIQYLYTYGIGPEKHMRSGEKLGNIY